MDRQELNELIAMYIVAVGEHGCPNSHVWTAVDPQMTSCDQHMLIVGALKGSGTLRESNDFLTLTAKGLEKLAKLEQVFNVLVKRN